jgi:hypothetical protein
MINVPKCFKKSYLQAGESFAKKWRKGKEAPPPPPPHLPLLMLMAPCQVLDNDMHSVGQYPAYHTARTPPLCCTISAYRGHFYAKRAGTGTTGTVSQAR